MRFAKVSYEMIKLKKCYKVRKMKKISLVLLSLLSLTACNSGSSSSSGGGSTYPSNPTNTLPNGYQCLPSGYPTSSSNSGSNAKIAYGSNCQVENVSNTSVQATLESMAVALTNAKGGRYCTGTPLSYDAATGVGYVLSAAHCVVGNPKSIGAEVTANNITTFTKLDPTTNTHVNYINQTLNASNSEDRTTGTITAVYIPSQYCQAAPFTLNRYGNYECGYLPAQNGDLALLKVNFTSAQSMSVNSQVKLAPSGLTMAQPSYIMALGYGITNTNDSNTNLFYITYEYFANNSYQGEAGLSALMNGYSPSGSDAYYSIICGGDSGGGDFYWDGTNWNLVGAHSYGSSICGAANVNYAGANDVSADVRPFASQLQQIMAQDTTPTGCNASVSGFICAAQSQ